MESAPPATEAIADETITRTFLIRSMVNPGALPSIAAFLESRPGIAAVHINPFTRQLTVTGSGDAIEAELGEIRAHLGEIQPDDSSGALRFASTMAAEARKRLVWPLAAYVCLLFSWCFKPASSFCGTGTLDFFTFSVFVFSMLTMLLARPPVKWGRKDPWGPRHIDRAIMAFAGTYGAFQFIAGYPALGTTLGAALLLVRRSFEVLAESIARRSACRNLESVGTISPEVANVAWNSQRQPIPLQHSANQLTCALVPITLITAAAAFAVWCVLPHMMYSLGAWGRDLLLFRERYVPQLVVVLGLLAAATPSAFALFTWPVLLRFTAEAASQGAVVRKVSSFQTLWETRLCAWARGGIVAEGKVRVEEVVTVSGCGEEEARTLAAQIEANSRHPAARALALPAAPMEWKEWAEHLDRGVVAHTEEHRYAIGNSLHLHSLDIDTQPFGHALYRFACEGRSAVLLARDEKALAAFKVFDPLRRESVKALKALRAFGCRSFLLSGEPEENVRIVGEQIGAEEIRPALTPQRAPGVVAGLKRETIGRVAVVARPEDAALFESADVSIAFGHGETPADIKVPGESLDEVVALFKDARAMRNRLYLLAILFGVYYLTVVPLALLGVLPVLGVAVMAGVMEMLPLLLCGRRVRSVR